MFFSSIKEDVKQKKLGGEKKEMMVTGGWILLGIGAFFSIIAVLIAALSKKEREIPLAAIICVAIGILFVGAAGYCSGIGIPEYLTLPPENETLVVKAAAEDEQSGFILVVSSTDKKHTKPIFYKISREIMPENISVGDTIVNDGGKIKKLPS